MKTITLLFALTSLPTLGVVTSITTAEGNGLDGSLIENNNGYNGSFDTTGGLTSYANVDNRHFTPVLKWDLSSYTGSSVDITDVSISLTPSGGGFTRTYSFLLFTGDNSEITPAIGYNAANPFIADDYIPETSVDADWDTNLTATFSGSITGTNLLLHTLGSGDAALLDAVKAAIDGDGYITFVIADNNRPLYLYSAESPDEANRPTLNITSVPEPSVALLGGLGVLGLIHRRRA